jgi:ABC-type Mn2+/Zn2+ transport system permease subunit
MDRCWEGLVIGCFCLFISCFVYIEREVVIVKACEHVGLG